MKMPGGTLYVAPVQPRITHHAKILSIDTSEAEKMPGVVRVITAKDVYTIGGNNMINQYVAQPRSKVTGIRRARCCAKRRSSATATSSPSSSRIPLKTPRAAAKKVHMEYEQLPEYMNVMDSKDPEDETRLFRLNLYGNADEK